MVGIGFLFYSSLQYHRAMTSLGKVYMYSGCSSNGNITGVELDPANNFTEIGQHHHVVVPDYKNRGYETGGDNNELDSPPYVG